MDKLPAFGTSLPAIIIPTFQTYAPLLLANSDAIRSIPCTSHQYGPHARHHLDIYHPATPTLSAHNRHPTLIFAYGGGLVNGARTLPFPAFQNLVYANIGAFFARTFGWTVAVIDYRLLEHGAQFPSGGDDVARAVDWLLSNPPAAQPLDLFMMGNSAGGIHLSTFLLHPEFEATRRRLLAAGADQTRLRGAIMLSVPLSFLEPRENPNDPPSTYFQHDLATNSPLGLLKAAQEEAQGRGQALDFVRAGVKVLVLNGELEPETDISIPRDEFIKQWMTMDDDESRWALVVDSMRGHNHISPSLSLGTGRAEEEAWGWQLAGFVEGITKFAPKTV